MPTDTAHLPALLEICQANGLPTHGWHRGDNDTWQRRTIINSDGRACSQYIRPCEATPTDLAAVCWEVAKWLSMEGIVVMPPPLKEGGRNPSAFVVYRVDVWSVKRITSMYDSEPAALVAACGGVTQ